MRKLRNNLFLFTVICFAGNCIVISTAQAQCATCTVVSSVHYFPIRSVTLQPISKEMVTDMYDISSLLKDEWNTFIGFFEDPIPSKLFLESQVRLAIERPGFSTIFMDRSGNLLIDKDTFRMTDDKFFELLRFLAVSIPTASVPQNKNFQRD